MRAERRTYILITILRTPGGRGEGVEATNLFSDLTLAPLNIGLATAYRAQNRQAWSTLAETSQNKPHDDDDVWPR